MIQKIEQVSWLSPDELIPYEMNAKMHPVEQVEHIANSIKTFGWTQPIVVDKDNVVVIGHGRLMAAKKLMLDKVPVVCRDDLTEEQINACRLADNKTNESEWDFGKLEEELAALDIAGIDMSQFGFDQMSADLEQEEERKGSMKEKYLVPPFSVIYGNKPDWLARKRAWVAFGIRSEIGRGGTCVSASQVDGETSIRLRGCELMGLLFNSKVATEPDYMRKKKAVEKKLGRNLTNEEFERDYYTGGVDQG